MTDRIADPSYIDAALDSRSICFENPTGARGNGGREGAGRKGAPSRPVAPGETVVLADIDGPGVIRHVWMTATPAPPETMRALYLEVRYDGAAEPSISAPMVDFFGVAHGRPMPYTSALTTIQGAVGFNSYFPMPFRDHVEVRFINGSESEVPLFYQIDYTLQRHHDEDSGYLHVAFNRENPTTLKRDFVIADVAGGPGRFLGCVVGVRVLDDGMWYGEGEVKIFRDGDTAFPTICGTGLEDYVGSAWGLAQHDALYGGAPLDVKRNASATDPTTDQSAYVSFYRWHVLDPVMFTDNLRVTIQQIGSDIFFPGQEEELASFRDRREITPSGWHEIPGLLGAALTERSDDYCATSFVYTMEPHAVPTIDLELATADLDRLPHEEPFLSESVMP
jgi:hypothetical protein